MLEGCLGSVTSRSYWVQSSPVGPRKTQASVDPGTVPAGQVGSVESWGGVISTAGGVVIFCEDSGALMAADAKDGKPLWSFQTNQLWKASPMTYVFDNKQYIAVAAGPNIIAFGL